MSRDIQCGITFAGWSTKPGFESYFHPFASMLDNLTMTQFVHNVEARVSGADVYAQATALLFIQQTAAAFVEVLEQGDLGEEAHERFNRRVNEHFEGTRDYIVTHYKTSSRRDTEYWRANAANLHLSDDLKKLFSAWMAGKTLVPGVRQQVIGKGYPVFSWYAIMAGMGIFPDRADLRPPTAQEARYSMAEIDNLLERSSRNFPDHAAALARIEPRRTEESLQIYLW